MPKSYNVAIVGATGTVGEMFVELLAARSFPVAKLFPVASTESAGKIIRYQGESIRVQALADFDFSQVDIAFFSAGSEVSKHAVPLAIEKGCLVIDNTAYFRKQTTVPLIVPEINLSSLRAEHALIANPNCSTIQLALALKPLYDAVGIEKVEVVTFQSVSGQGRAAIERLASETARRLRGEHYEREAGMSPPIAFNVLPEVGEIQDSGYSTEELKLMEETRKIFSDESLIVNATAVRVPVFFGHSEAVHIKTKEAITPQEAAVLFSQAEGVKYFPNSAPTPLIDLEKHANEVLIGRLRQALHSPCELNFWVVADNVRKGAALNALQIAESVIQKGFI
eukprot:TRINITY_DN42679_c0_g1_i1.p1 TRINITY_DN42679_c0_g1~~TRINITY_DN42679_c0_g1_i1.p1  ORF type:complete len:338 (+),score=-49.32 TRINITY_DN42679_c0_g1_i1:397-1410(+)